MISSKRRQRAENDGKMACIQTRANAHLTKNPYTKHSAQWKAFCKGWNYIRNRFKFLRKV